MSIHRLVILQTMYGQKKKLSTFSYKLVQISPIMILVNSGAFLSISSWFCELTELIFVMIPYISSTGYPPKTNILRLLAGKFGKICTAFPGCGQNLGPGPWATLWATLF